MNNITAAIRMLLFIVGSAIFVPLAWMARQLSGGNVEAAKLFHKMACIVFGIKIRTIGTPREHGDTPTMFVANHLSYLDIVVLGSLINARFVAKADVAGWPVFGVFAKVQRTIFIERTKEALENSKHMIGAAMKEGYNTILFAEGTSTDGRDVLQFKAGLLDVFYNAGVKGQVQPVAITLDAKDDTTRDLYTWWRPEATLAPHLWNFAKAGGVNVTVHYLPVLDFAAYKDRKALANATHEAVARVVREF